MDQSFVWFCFVFLRGSPVSFLSVLCPAGKGEPGLRGAGGGHGWQSARGRSRRRVAPRRKRGFGRWTGRARRAPRAEGEGEGRAAA